MSIDTQEPGATAAGEARIAGGLLSEHQRLPTSGARTALPFELDGTLLLAVPQLSEDIPGQDAHMNGGNSDVDAIIYRWENGRFHEHERLFTPAGEDILVFTMGDDLFLGTASIRTGSGPYEMNAFASIYRRENGAWVPFQSIPTFAGKQLYHFTFDGRHFLGLAQGVTLPHAQPRHPRESCILEFTGDRFEQFQVLDGKWGYNWHFFEVGGQRFLAYADHSSPSLVYRWDGSSFAPFQVFSELTGRAFTSFEQDGQFYLVHAAIQGDTTLHRWDGATFVEQQVLGGSGGREFELIRTADDLYLVRICFILGTPADPKTDLQSQIYRWSDGGFVAAGEFPTFGGTDANAFTADGERYLAVSNSLRVDKRFRQDTVIYRLHL
ncbi:MAG: hypothetical protein JWL96_215 [Sphingomonas bacterium]|uniref:hypothetical protein n=1 Tax=Sphingomonas bacterium TaxID=1895847 RepID=UPI002625FAFD|nr:hypothetical protein [Sphingomonas bacterium]MDB5708145.1 hypothetical protein [Sphingomonas bacterium]